MTADTFLVCFLACTFSFAVFGVVFYQLVFFLSRRWFKKHGVKAIQQILAGPAAAGQMDAFTAGFNLTGGQAVRDLAAKATGFDAYSPTHAEVICPSCRSLHVITFAELRELPIPMSGGAPLALCTACKSKSAA